MKKLFGLLSVVLVLVSTMGAFAKDSDVIKSTYLYNEVVIKQPSWLFFTTLVRGDNLKNEDYVSMRITPWKPLRETWGGLFLDAGMSLRNFSYQTWDEATRTLSDQEEQLLEAFFGPEVTFNYPPSGLHTRVRGELNIGRLSEMPKGSYLDYLFMGQLRWFPNAWFQSDVVYCYANSSDRGGIRQPGENANLRFRTGFCFGKVFETGVQTTWEFYQSEIWESQFRPAGGMYARIINLPGWLKYFWIEASWEQMNVKEIDLRINKVQPELRQNRVMVAFGFSQDPNLAEMRRSFR